VYVGGPLISSGRGEYLGGAHHQESRVSKHKIFREQEEGGNFLESEAISLYGLRGWQTNRKTGGSEARGEGRESILLRGEIKGMLLCGAKPLSAPFGRGNTPKLWSKERKPSQGKESPLSESKKGESI